MLLSADAPVYAVIDTNVALHQADVLEHPAVRDVVVCETVLNEAEHRNRAAGARLRALCQPSSGKRFLVFANDHHRATYVARAAGESANDHNDRAIRAAAAWYGQRVAAAAAAAAAAAGGGGGPDGGASRPPRPPPRVVLVTDDAASRAAALAGGIEAVGTLQFARMCADVAPDLADLVARGGGGASAGPGAEEGMDVDGGSGGGGGGGGGAGKTPSAGGGAASASRAAKRQRIFPEHLSPEQLAAGLAAGRLHQGSLRASRYNPFEGRVTVSAAVGGGGGGGAAAGGGAKEGVAGGGGGGSEILVSGRLDMNRAFDGDIVVIEVHPEAEWRLPPGAAARRGGAGDRNEPSDEPAGAGGADGDGDDPDGRDGERGAFQVMGASHFDGADAAEAEAEAGGEGDEWGPGASRARPTGRVVGVSRRAWRPRGYAGSLDPRDVGLEPRVAGGLLEPVSDGRTVQALFVPVDRRFPKIR